MCRFSGTKTTVADGTSLAKQIAGSFGSKAFESATSQAEMDSLWAARKTALWAMLAVRPEGTQIWSTDVAVPLSRMAELIGRDTFSTNDGHGRTH